MDNGDLYIKGKNRYEVAGKVYGQDWAGTPSAHIFPRMWNNSNERGEIDVYRQYGGLSEGEQPTMMSNIKYFISYQTYWMYLRYFFWSFTGKQNDLQGFGNVRDGNAITGISFIDNLFYGDQSKLPDSIHTNDKAYNRLYALPFILGLIGIYLQYRRARTGLLCHFPALLFHWNGRCPLPEPGRTAAT